MEENFDGMNEELDNIIILNDENGEEVKFEFLDLVELDDEEYVVLLPVTDEGEEDEGEVVILKVEDNDDETVPVAEDPRFEIQKTAIQVKKIGE